MVPLKGNSDDVRSPANASGSFDVETFEIPARIRGKTTLAVMTKAYDSKAAFVFAAAG